MSTEAPRELPQGAQRQGLLPCVGVWTRLSNCEMRRASPQWLHTSHGTADLLPKMGLQILTDLEITVAALPGRSCVDENDRRQPLGSTWRTNDPCTNHTCTEKGVTSVSVTCALSGPPREGCFEYTPEEECCSRWNCSGCLDDYGVFHRIFEAWSSDACTRHFCASSGIITQELQCPPLGTIPHPNCVMHQEPGECCSRWKCGPDCRLVLCPQPPGGTCTTHRPPLACCDEYQCSTGCTDNQGRKRNLGDTWFTPPCLLYICRDEGVVTHNFCDAGSLYRNSTNLKRSAGFDEPAYGSESKKAATAAPSLPDQAS
ncbi:hypothetical protein E2C01_011420 [Portunus trituberculatus]|uniref:VWFC domain-containing protein n=1 Tax=Portunus trituberculatus TaxID=210409 RepID=A0A5B7DBB8_PORTR|nr:hypothetical protein [Portunus trituberculatus]